MVGVPKNKPGQRFSRLTIIQRNPRKSATRTVYWDCLCDCGKTITVLGVSLNSGNTKSCGCLQKDYVKTLAQKTLTTHGLTKNKFYKHWKTMRFRCLSPKYHGYKYYGGRGIFICPEWLNTPDAFVKWAEKQFYKDGWTLERNDPDKDYGPDNCCFLSKTDQAKSVRKRFTVFTPSL